MRLSTFAFLHPIEEAQLQVFRDALPGVEVLQLAGDALPKGLERAEAAAISWTGPPIDTILDAAPRLQWLHQRGAGIDRISTPKLVASDPNRARAELAEVQAVKREALAEVRETVQGYRRRSLA